MPIRKILIANRGEIAIRIARACRELGIESVAIYSDADRNAPHVEACGEAVAIGPSYLDIEKIVDAARRTGADAVHPGYGFLSENAEFAEACRDAGLTFIGPSPEAIRKMGQKISARNLASGAGVPVVPSFEPTGELPFPILIKASAGGGGRGMRIVRDRSELEAALEAARGEAERSFGDGSLLIERYIEGARHVEFQIFGDLHGQMIHLFERDCSLQRRHQKIVEESPSPALDGALRQRMGEAAVALGRAIGYSNAGTVEFLVTPEGEFYFIEMNTRIQVEHPVTELVTALDLVRLQIEVADGGHLPAQPQLAGHAIQARLYAENPANGFLPSSGEIRRWRAPDGIRVDHALAEGQEVGIHYDPLLAKIISHGKDRAEAIGKLLQALRGTCVLGVQTNREFLMQLLDSGEFREGRASTAFLPPVAENAAEESTRVVAAILYLESLRDNPLANYRNNPYRDPSAKFRLGDETIAVDWKRFAKGVYEIRHAGEAHRCRILHGDADAFVVEIHGLTKTFSIAGTPTEVFVHSPSGDTILERLSRHPRRAAVQQRHAANSPMPGKVLRVLVSAGQQVKMSDPLVVLEAMKMEQTIRTTINGVVQTVLVKVGQVVAPGQKLVEVSAQENAI